MSDVDDLTPWLRARLTEDEAGLRTWLTNLPTDSGAADWVRQWLADLDAKRRILGQLEMWALRHDPERADDFPGTTGGVAALLTVVRTLALPYADRPGYREEWRPTR